MATTEQRTGFRLPWASDTRSSASAPDQSGADLASTKAGGHPTADDNEAAGLADTGARDDATGAATGALAWPAADTIHEQSDPAHGAPGHGADAAGDPADAGPETASTATPTAAPARQRRDNPLVTGLVKAMRDAATATRHEAASRFAEEAKARVEAIHVHSADAAAALRKRADADIVEIRDWSKAEMAHVRELTDSKIAARRELLEADVEALSARVEHRIEEVRGAIGDFERQMDAFFERLLAEEDPARLAGLAQQLPEAPVLEIDISGPATPTAVLDAGGAAAAEAEALGEVDTLAGDGSDDMTEADIPVIPDVARRLALLSEPGGFAHAPVTSRVAVSGLASVASIAGFKRALAKSTGVRSVSVASGPTGDFIFTVAHESETDLRSAVPKLDGFFAVVTGYADDVITVTATDPERVK